MPELAWDYGNGHEVASKRDFLQGLIRIEIMYDCVVDPSYWSAKRKETDAPMWSYQREKDIEQVSFGRWNQPYQIRVMGYGSDDCTLGIRWASEAEAQEAAEKWIVNAMLLELGELNLESGGKLG